MNNKMKKSIEKLTNMDTYENINVRRVYIDNIVSNLKRGIFPKGALNRIETIINRHNRIKKIKKYLKNRG